MKAKELRIGNYLNFKLGSTLIHCTVKEVKSITVKTTAFYAPIRYDKIEPIPLTDERLVMFGFVNKKGTFQRGYHNPKFSGLIIISYIENVSQWSLSIGEYKYITEFEYVHEFQNIIHALTGEELEVK